MTVARLALPALLALAATFALPAPGAHAARAGAPVVLSSMCSDLGPFGLLVPVGGFTTGCGRRFTLKLGASLGPDGNYIMLDYPSCPSGPCAGLTGTAGVGCQAIDSYECCLGTSQVVPTVSGTNIALLVTGINSRIGNDTDTRTNICFSQYTGDGKRVLYVPTMTSTAGSGFGTLTGFVEIFLAAPPTGTGNSTTFLVEFLSTDATPALPETWGRVKTIYR